MIATSSTAWGLILILAISNTARAQYTATYLPWTAPDKTESSQTGTNKCGTTASQTSMCQNVYINSADDFCLWAPPTPGAGSTIGNTEQIEVAWCVKDGYGTRLIPEGTLRGVHFVQTPDYVQVTGVGDFTKINIPAGDEGGELDPHGADGNGNPHGGLVFSSAFGALQQVHEWTNFMSETEFCIRGCKDGNTNKAKALCQHIYDVMGCFWNMPGDYDAGVFENCKGDSGEPMGVYGTSTFHQGDPVTPSAHPAPATSQCATIGSVGSGGTAPPFSTNAPQPTSTRAPAPTSSPSTTNAPTTSLLSPTSPVSSASSSSPSPTTLLSNTSSTLIVPSNSTSSIPQPSATTATTTITASISTLPLPTTSTNAAATSLDTAARRLFIAGSFVTWSYLLILN